jgi:pyruvate dehydrogenase E2 component (dihydrolipoamide acetyltransferase)
MPLSLSYDHRLIDGAAAARFTRLVCDLLARPTELLLSL